MILRWYQQRRKKLPTLCSQILQFWVTRLQLSCTLFPIHAICCAHLIALCLITRAVFREACKSCHFSLCAKLRFSLKMGGGGGDFWTRRKTCVVEGMLYEVGGLNVHYNGGNNGSFEPRWFLTCLLVWKRQTPTKTATSLHRPPQCLHSTERSRIQPKDIRPTRFIWRLKISKWALLGYRSHGGDWLYQQKVKWQNGVGLRWTVLRSWRTVHRAFVTLEGAGGGAHRWDVWLCVMRDVVNKIFALLRCYRAFIDS